MNANRATREHPRQLPILLAAGSILVTIVATALAVANGRVHRVMAPSSVAVWFRGGSDQAS